MPTNSLPLGRRDFLRAGTAGALSLAGLRALFAADEKAPAGAFALGAQSYTFRNFNTEQALSRLKDLGLGYVEFYRKHAPPEATAEQLAALRKLCGEYGVKPLAFGVQRFTKDHDANRKLFDFGKALGVRMFSADPTPDSFDSLDKCCEEYKIAVGIHPHGPQGRGLHRWYSAEVILKAVKDHHPLIGSCLDTGHLIRAAQLGKKLDPAEEILTMGKRNHGLHLKDHDNKTKHDVIFGKAALDVPAVVKALREVKFKGLISIEYEASPEEPTADVRACVKVFRDAAGK